MTANPIHMVSITPVRVVITRQHGERQYWKPGPGSLARLTATMNRLLDRNDVYGTVPLPRIQQFCIRQRNGLFPC